jgi:hypothetical protein
MVVLGEHVDHGDRAVLGYLLDDRVRPGADRDRLDQAREHQRRVARRLAPRQLQLALAQHQRVAAQLDDAGLERHARARGRLVEHQRDAHALERARAQAVLLELDRALDQLTELLLRELFAC